MKTKSELHSVDSFHYKMCPPPLSPLSVSSSSTPPPLCLFLSFLFLNHSGAMLKTTSSTCGLGSPGAFSQIPASSWLYSWAGFILSLQSRYVSQEHSRDHTTLKTMCILLLSMILPLPLCKCYVYITIFSLHRNVCISGTSSGTYPVFAYSVVLFQYFRMVSVLCSSGGEQNVLRKTEPLFC